MFKQLFQIIFGICATDFLLLYFVGLIDLLITCGQTFPIFYEIYCENSVMWLSHNYSSNCDVIFWGTANGAVFARNSFSETEWKMKFEDITFSI